MSENKKTRSDRTRTISVRVPETEWQALRKIRNKVNIAAILRGQVSLLTKHINPTVKGEAASPYYYSCSTGNVNINFNTLAL